MSKVHEVYKCEACGAIVSILHAAAPNVLCCGKPMKLMVENTVEASKEKHIPVIEKTASGIKVKVGSVPHPMEEKHYIEWIEVISEDEKNVSIHFLKPSDKPETDFCSGLNGGKARAYCNLHGLWKS
ncbi:desulfoferrodoxin [bacterium]|nr:desulfoferrodoxin [bacterium]